MKSLWIEFTPEDPILGPPKPLSCLDGWESHEWLMDIEEGRILLHCGCKLCDDGVQEVEPEYFYGSDIPVKLEFIKDVGGSYETPEIDVYWMVEAR